MVCTNSTSQMYSSSCKLKLTQNQPHWIDSTAMHAGSSHWNLIRDCKRFLRSLECLRELQWRKESRFEWSTSQGEKVHDAPFRNEERNESVIYELTFYSCEASQMNIQFLRTEIAIHVRRHDGTCGQKPVKKALQSQLQKVTPSQKCQEQITVENSRKICWECRTAAEHGEKLHGATPTNGKEMNIHSKNSHLILLEHLK